jgi:hypothetical protein
VPRIEIGDGQRVIKDGGRFVKRNAMLLPIAVGFVGIPFEVNAAMLRHACLMSKKGCRLGLDLSSGSRTNHSQARFTTPSFAIERRTRNRMALTRRRRDRLVVDCGGLRLRSPNVNDQRGVR